MENNTKMRTVELCQAALCVALLCVSAYISIPLPFTAVPLTAQNFVVNIVALILAPQYALLAQVVYTLIGIAGVPVFSGGRAGMGVILGPTGGYLIGFIVAAFVMSLAKRGKCSVKRYLFITLCIGLPIIYILGTIGMAFQVQKGIWALLIDTVVPFLPLDIVKCIVASIICAQLNKILKKSHLIR